METLDTLEDLQMIGTPALAQLLGLHPRTVQHLIKTGQLPGRKLGRTWKVRVQELRRFLAANGAAAPSALAGPEAQAGPSPAALSTPPAAPHEARKAALLARLQALQAEGLSTQAMANHLNAEGVPTLSGRGRWQKGTISTLLAQAEGTR